MANAGNDLCQLYESGATACVHSHGVLVDFQRCMVIRNFSLLKEIQTENMQPQNLSHNEGVGMQAERNRPDYLS